MKTNKNTRIPYIVFFLFKKKSISMIHFGEVF